MEFTILMPCLNEAETVATCVRKARTWLDERGFDGEVLIADNGSSDGSQELAQAAGARVIAAPRRGYGAALRAGIEAAKGRYTIMGDADDSYDFSNLDAFVEPLRSGYPLVMGNRFSGGIEPGAMPVLHRYLGNPVLSYLGRWLFGLNCADFHCGQRGFDTAAMRLLGLHSPGMEFASEMVVKAALTGWEVAEVPVRLYPDGRSRPPHLKTWRDGWRHLRFLLAFCPRWLYLIPGLSMLLLGLGLWIWLLPSSRTVAGVTFDIHTLSAASVFLSLGHLTLLFSFLAKRFAVAFGLHPRPAWTLRLEFWTNLEIGLIVASVLGLSGFLLCGSALRVWIESGLGNLNPERTLRLMIPGATLIVLAAQTALASFFAWLISFARENQAVAVGDSNQGG